MRTLHLSAAVVLGTLIALSTVSACGTAEFSGRESRRRGGRRARRRMALGGSRRGSRRRGGRRARRRMALGGSRRGSRRAAADVHVVGWPWVDPGADRAAAAADVHVVGWPWVDPGRGSRRSCRRHVKLTPPNRGRIAPEPALGTVVGAYRMTPVGAISGVDAAPRAGDLSPPTRRRPGAVAAPYLP